MPDSTSCSLPRWTIFDCYLIFSIVISPKKHGNTPDYILLQDISSFSLPCSSFSSISCTWKIYSHFLSFWKLDDTDYLDISMWYASYCNWLSRPELFLALDASDSDCLAWSFQTILLKYSSTISSFHTQRSSLTAHFVLPNIVSLIFTRSPFSDIKAACIFQKIQGRIYVSELGATVISLL